MAAIYDALSALCGDEKYADLTVTCGEHSFKLHRTVLCSQSPFFDKACSGGFMVSLHSSLAFPFGPFRSVPWLSSPD